MAVTYTPADEYFVAPTGSGTAWADYDIFTNKGIPKGAVADITARMSLHYQPTGVRTDGSAIDRRVGGVGTPCTTRWWVKVDSSTGLIEIYKNNIYQIVFMVVGYFEGVDYTEAYTEVTVDSSHDAMWTTVDFEATYSIPASSVMTVQFWQKRSSGSTVGIREQGSALNRYLDLGSPEYSATYSYTPTLEMSVQLDADGEAQIYLETYNNTKMMITGYFGEELTFTEGWDTWTETINTWSDEDLSAYIDEDGRVVEMIVGHEDIAAGSHAILCVGTSDTHDDGHPTWIPQLAALYEGKAGSTYNTNTQSCETASADGTIGQYCNNNSLTVHFWCSGYFDFGGGGGGGAGSRGTVATLMRVCDML